MSKVLPTSLLPEKPEANPEANRVKLRLAASVDIQVIASSLEEGKEIVNAIFTPGKSIIVTHNGTGIPVALRIEPF